MTTWFTSDTHYGHAAIIEFCERPFKDVADMNEGLIANFNAVVRPEDTVYHLGDFAMKIRDDEIRAIIRRLNGHKHLILGNHDERTIARHSSSFKATPGDPNLFESITPGIREISVEKQKIVLCHYSMVVWHGSHKGAYHLYGHSHGSLAEDPHRRSFDVGVDAQDYVPISFEDVKKRMEKKEWKPIDHHQER